MPSQIKNASAAQAHFIVESMQQVLHFVQFACPTKEITKIPTKAPILMAKLSIPLAFLSQPLLMVAVLFFNHPCMTSKCCHYGVSTPVGLPVGIGAQEPLGA